MKKWVFRRELKVYRVKKEEKKKILRTRKFVCVLKYFRCAVL